MTVTPTAGQVQRVSYIAEALADIQAQLDALTVNNPRCRVSRSSNQTINIVTGTPIAFDVESWDVGPMHSGSDTKLISPLAGLYQGVGQGYWDTNTLGFRRIEARVNGTTVIASTKVEAEGTDPTDQNFAWDSFLDVTDYVELVFYFDAAGGDPATLDAVGAFLTAHWYGSTT